MSLGSGSTPIFVRLPIPVHHFFKTEHHRHRASGNSHQQVVGALFSQYLFKQFTIPSLCCHSFLARLRRLVVILLLLFCCELLPVRVVIGMRLVVQKVKSASVTVEGKVVSSIGPGIMALVGIHEHDTEEDLKVCCKRLLGVKLWENENGGLWRHGVKQRDYSVLLVSQFTLYGTVSNKKYQPDYKLAMKAVPAEMLYRQFLDLVRSEYKFDKVHDGVFGAMMDVALVNDGPVTILIESEPKAPVNQDQPLEEEREEKERVIDETAKS